jgi:hypothetical protein
MRVWAGATISGVGDQITGLALPWLVLRLTHSPGQLGIVLGLLDLSLPAVHPLVQRLPSLHCQPEEPPTKLSRRVAHSGALARAAFAEAVEVADHSPLELNWDRVAVKMAETAAKPGGLLLVGETHGVVENARLIAGLIERFEFPVLALEWPCWWATPLEAWLNGGALPFATLAGDDGRLTAGHLGLLRRLWSDNRLAKLILFDGLPGHGPEFWNQRDASMAATLLAERRADLATLAIAGNMHTGTRKIRWRDPGTGGRGKGTLRPTGWHLSRALPQLVPAVVSYRSGGFWNLGERQFGKGSLRDGPVGVRLEDGVIRFEVPVAHPAAVPAHQQPADPGLRAELLRRMQAEQRPRTELIEWQKAASASGPDEFAQRWKVIQEADRENTEWLRGIVREHDWPGWSQVGPDGENAAFLIAQHTPDLDFQRDCLTLVEEAVACGEAHPSHFAYLIDRVRLAEGNSQIYGTQAQGASGRYELQPLEKPAEVDDRRRRVGLGPLHEYMIALNKLYKP